MAGLDYSYKRVGTRGYLDTLGAVERSIRAHGFAVSHVHDIQATLASKGFSIDPLRIYEINGRRPLLGAGGDAAADKVSMLMPCRVNVFIEDGDVVVAAVRPTVMCQVFPEADLTELAEAVEAIVVELVDESVA